MAPPSVLMRMRESTGMSISEFLPSGFFPFTWLVLLRCRCRSEHMTETRDSPTTHTHFWIAQTILDALH